MARAKSFLRFLYQHPFVRYVFVGGSTFVIDFTLLYVLHESLDINLPISTTVAYWASIVYNFMLNRWWTFSASENKKLHKHATAYLVLLGFNYIFTVIFVSLMSHIVYFGIAKVLAVAIQILWTYRIYKNVIFADKPNGEPASPAVP